MLVRSKIISDVRKDSCSSKCACYLLAYPRRAKVRQINKPCDEGGRTLREKNSKNKNFT